MRVVGAAMLAVCVLLGACGASFAGVDTTGAVDPCHNHLQCPRGCCMWASFDGYGFDCIALDEQRTGVCVPVTVVNPGMTGAKPTPDAG